MSDVPPVLGPTMPLPSALATSDAARAEAEALLAEANRMHRQAVEDADRIRAAAKADVERARADVRRVREEAQAAVAAKAERGVRFDVWSLRVALAATIILTASGEYSLAVLAGWPGWLAWALPLGIDVYVVQAMRRRRDVASAVLLMVAANAIFHLADAGLFGTTTDAAGVRHPTWWLIVGVASIAPWVMLRIHHIGAPKTRQEKPAAATATPEAPPAKRPETPPQKVPAPAPAAPPQSATPPATKAPATTPRKAATKTAPSPAPKRHKGADRGAAKAAIRALYDKHGRRPLEGEMTDELERIKSPHTSRQFANKLRGEIEEKNPNLAGLGTANVRPIGKTGS